MDGVAVNVTAVPAQTLLADATMLTEGVAVGLTVIETAVAVAIGMDGQVAEEVICTVTASPLDNDALE